MIKDIFRFKEFEIDQTDVSMKVGTDAVLVGSWADCRGSENILDIGTGTGIISLMLAQRFPKIYIKAIEIQKKSFLNAKLNFQNSKWSDRLEAINVSLLWFSTYVKFDFIISNPPFYKNKFKSDNIKNNISKHIDDLTFDVLIQKTVELLNVNGRCAFIIPFENKEEFIDIAKSKNLLLSRFKNVKGNQKSNIKRSLLEFTFHKSDILEEEILIIEDNRNNYTKQYINYTSDFYLKM